MFHKMNCRMILVLSIVLFVGSGTASARIIRTPSEHISITNLLVFCSFIFYAAFSLRCYVCETDLCNDLKKLEPRVMFNQQIKYIQWVRMLNNMFLFFFRIALEKSWRMSAPVWWTSLKCLSTLKLPAPSRLLIARKWKPPTLMVDNSNV